MTVYGNKTLDHGRTFVPVTDPGEAIPDDLRLEELYEGCKWIVKAYEDGNQANMAIQFEGLAVTVSQIERLWPHWRDAADALFGGES